MKSYMTAAFIGLSADNTPGYPMDILALMDSAATPAVRSAWVALGQP